MAVASSTEMQVGGWQAHYADSCITDQADNTHSLFRCYGSKARKMTYADAAFIPFLDGLAREVFNGHVLCRVGKILMEIYIFSKLFSQAENIINMFEG